MANTIYWHDYETFGSDPRRDRPCQFAGIRTDEDLNIIDEPLTLYCRPSPDFLPDPESCLITGISPATALEKGLSEADFCARIHAELSRPGTCVAGYNSIRFDDEVTRHLLYRCFFDPYEREWKNGNSRWDVLDMLRLAHAVRPEGINWPRRADGSPSFRLEDLTRANDIGHAQAHDALADVLATIGMARLVRRQQPKLYDYLFQRRGKRAILPLLLPQGQQPLLHVSAMYPASRGCLSVVQPLVRHPANQNGVVVYDLAADPSAWMSLDVEEIRARLFTPVAELPPGIERIGLKTVHANKCPVLAPLSVLNEQVCSRWSLDLPQYLRHRELLLAHGEAAAKVTAALLREDERLSQTADPDQMLYSGGFFEPADRAAMDTVRTLDEQRLARFRGTFKDGRLQEMLLRYRARNYPASLNPDEQQHWRQYCRGSLQQGNCAGLAWQPFWTCLEALERQHPERAPLLHELREYASGLGRQFGLSGAPSSPVNA